MVIKLQSVVREHLIFILTILLLVALFTSRVMLSATIAAMLVSSCWITGVRSLFHNYFRSPLLLIISCLFFLPLISGLWSEDHTRWLSVLRIKLPLLILPLVFAGNIKFNSKQLLTIAIIFLLLVFAGTIWSSYYYFSDMTAAAERYLRSISIPTPLENDHIRFSWLIAVAVLVCFRLYKEKYFRVVIVIIAVWFIIYLHLLAARTGLICLYIVLLFILLQLIKRVWIAPLIIALPLLAYFLFPTFQNRIRYILYDHEYFSKFHYLPGGNDASRMISIRAGWDLASNNLIKGVGFGDIREKTNEWYDLHYPGMLTTDKLYPSSEWLMYSLGNGWLGILLIAIVSGYPFFIHRSRRYHWWIAVCCMASFNLIFDIPLETQFGIVIYCFSLLFAYSLTKDEKTVIL